MRFRILCELRRESCLPFHIRRQGTGATLMYLDRMDIYDIMKITEHSTPGKVEEAHQGGPAEGGGEDYRQICLF